MQITPQSQQYGLPDKGARTLPTAREVADLMRAPGIPHGTMSRNKTAAGGVDPRMDDAPTLREHEDRDWKRLEDEADAYYADPHRKPYGPLHDQGSPDFSGGGRTALYRHNFHEANYDDDDSQACDKCGDRVYTVSNRGWCDGCEEEADHAGTHGYAPHPRPRGHD